ncbi:MAG TPA: PfkB family carbohydrate kinase [Terriglobales bacterium]|nr:PfkB family carbohydrate kinase [Terriglobales bacterium]
MAVAKVLELDELAARVSTLRAAGKRVVLCHGVFDLLHVGHLRHLEAARRLGDALVLTITPDHYVNKGPDRPAFSERLRAEMLAALDCIDLIAINRWPTAVETIRLLRPDVYVKGVEYQETQRDVTGGIDAELAAIEAIGGRLAFTDELTFSSSNLLNRHLPVLPEEARAFLTDFRSRYSAADIEQWIDHGRDLRVLVVGETIVDEYQYCHAIGKSSKSAAVVAQTQSSERFAGGIVAVANHLASFCEQVTLVTQLGDRSRHEEFVRSQLAAAVTPVFLTRRDAPTIVKRRFIESYLFTPMLEIYEINDESLRPEDDAELCQALRQHLPAYDLVVTVDYGHSMLTEAAVELLCGGARFLAMNAQANAGNRGYHRLSKYRRADYICAAEHEIYLEARDWRGDLRPVVLDVQQRMSCSTAIVTRGKRGALGYRPADGFVEVPALAAKVIDRVGAGDAFLAITAPLAARGAPLELAAFVGNVAGAEAVATVGHRTYLSRQGLIKHVRALLA